jgi:SAM-dependent methyltransferase
MTNAVYDAIGGDYTAHRRPDPRVAAQIDAALAGAASVINVGAGAGSYEPTDRFVVAVDASMQMIRQRAAGTAPPVLGLAEHLPVRSGAFDAALVSLSLHHWPDLAGGVAELRRVARRQVIFTFDPIVHVRFWLIEDYLPSIATLEATQHAPIDAIVGALVDAEVQVVPVPHDCIDGFMWAHWRRPEAYLDPSVRACMSGIALLDPAEVADGVARLRADLDSGEWHRRNAELLDRDAVDGGFRLIVAGQR